jgi:indole-3-glycerol phosphate synthase
MNILEQIIADKRIEIAAAREKVSLASMREQALAQSTPPDFRAALSARPVGLIAEVKRRSPSAGMIRDPFDPAEIARAYEQGGAQALSVLMDGKYFGGGADDFRAVRAAVCLPLLYKEFVVDAWQVWHARALGASAVLLIVAALSPEELRALMDVIDEAGLQALVEVHDEDEARVAVEVGATIIGINNRNLKNFVTTLETTGQVARNLPPDAFVISESGIRNAEDVRHVQALGARAVLVGEHLLRKDDLARAVGELMEPAWMSL